MKLIDAGYFDCGEGNSISKITNNIFDFINGTIFGVVLDGCATVNGRLVNTGEYFCRTSPVTIEAKGTTATFIRNDWIGDNVIAGTIAAKGNVKYIDGCTDSLLVCPPKLGDPCLNALYFPPHTNQTFHTHPSQRLGAILSGKGYACMEDGEIPLTLNTVFILETGNVHRFRTEEDPMVVIAYHPDSDWGPTDETHPMINRTIIS